MNSEHSRNEKVSRVERLQIYCAITQCILSVVALIGSVAVALFVWHSQAVMTARQINKSSRDSWIAIDLAALSNDQLLVAADNLLDPSVSSLTLDQRRRRWMSFAVINILVERHDAAEEGLIGPREDVLASTRQLLSLLMAHDDVFDMVQKNGYEKRHLDLFRSIRGEIVRERAKPPAH